MPFRICDLFSDYLRHQDINDYLDYLQTTYPELVTVATLGHSHEQRPIKFIRISSSGQESSTTKSSSNSFVVCGKALSVNRPHRSAVPRATQRRNSTMSASRIMNSNGIFGNARCRTAIGMNTSNRNQQPQSEQRHKDNNNNDNIRSTRTKQIMPTMETSKATRKSIVLIDGGLHAREWATVSTALYCINQLVEHFVNNRRMLLQHDFVIVPIVNVDGYEYTHVKVSNSHANIYIHICVLNQQLFLLSLR